ncbi:hypothetical protein SDC9_118780 [bioreactor metagenome]|uniref:Uncharacterized protein n=1 Tax=bioreactor metagenome TaxID=1076179 RepID=A0A645C2G9_9ZZZZ
MRLCERKAFTDLVSRANLRQNENRLPQREGCASILWQRIPLAEGGALTESGAA